MKETIDNMEKTALTLEECSIEQSEKNEKHVTNLYTLHNNERTDDKQTIE